MVTFASNPRGESKHIWDHIKADANHYWVGSKVAPSATLGPHSPHSAHPAAPAHTGTDAEPVAWRWPLPPLAITLTCTLRRTLTLTHVHAAPHITPSIHQLLWVDIKIATRLVSRMMGGSTLTRRERKQLIRTTTDIMRIVVSDWVMLCRCAAVPPCRRAAVPMSVL